MLGGKANFDISVFQNWRKRREVFPAPLVLD
jgi:hypothetical protein